LVLVLGTDWATISSLATAGGTLVLALATFASVRSANRSTRIAQEALQEQRRPVLAPSRLEDPAQKIMFMEGKWVRAEGGRAAVEHVNGTVYLAISLRNVGSGIGVCQGWFVRRGDATTRTQRTHVPVNQFHLHARDLYIPAGDIGMWQGALRDPDDRVRADVVEAIESQEPITVELLYSNQVGQQWTITRFGLVPAHDTWMANMNRHWYLDWDGPRSESVNAAATEAVLRDQALATERRAAQDEADGQPAAAELEGV
jgi:hypothetical protein